MLNSSQMATDTAVVTVEGEQETRGAPDPQFSDPAGSGPDPTTLNPAGSGSILDPDPNSGIQASYTVFT